MDILDASSLLALIKKEKGAEIIKNRLDNAESERDSVFIHQINFIEVMYTCLKKFGELPTEKLIADLKSPFLGIVNYMDTDLALYAASLKSAYDLSLGDATGLAFTKIMDGVFWTNDKALAPVARKEGIRIKVLA